MSSEPLDNARHGGGAQAAGTISSVRGLAFSGTAAALAVLLLASFAPVARAHGPCGCVDPRIVQAGAEVRIAAPTSSRSAGTTGYPAYRVLFNPRPGDLGIAPRHLASAHRRDVPTTTVLDRPRRAPTRNGRFSVPQTTPPGVYLVLIFDGGEGGAHNTWDYVHVVDSDEAAAAGTIAAGSGRAGSADGGAGAPTDEAGPRTPRWPLLGGVGLAGLLAGMATSAAVRRRRR